MLNSGRLGKLFYHVSGLQWVGKLIEISPKFRRHRHKITDKTACTGQRFPQPWTMQPQTTQYEACI